MSPQSTSHAMSQQPDEVLAFDRYVIRAADLHAMLGDPMLRIVDLRPAEHGAEGYIPGSVHLDYGRLVRREGPVEGLLPSPEDVAALLSSLGIEPGHRVVAYDDETGVEAARLLWTLAVAGHEDYALLDGGFSAWQAGDYPVAARADFPAVTSWPAIRFNEGAVDMDYVRSALSREDVTIVDTRSAAEYSGEEARAKHAGRIPGAVHFDWVNAIDLFGTGELLPRDEVLEKLAALEIHPAREVILYCQSNRRCAHTFVVLRWLGFDNVHCYAGSWSEWGNADDTPVER